VSRYVLVQTDDFEEFYKASYRRVVALVAAIVGDRHQAEDIAQEAFSRALTRWHRVARYELPEAWVRRVALRLTIDAARRTRRVRIMSALLAVGQRGASSDRYDLQDPLEATALSVALMRLPIPQRQVLVLYYEPRAANLDAAVLRGPQGPWSALTRPGAPRTPPFAHKFHDAEIIVVDLAFVVENGSYSCPDQPQKPDQPRY